MTDEAKAARRAYNRAWARQNADKRRAAQERYWKKRAEAQKREPAKKPAAAPAE